MFDTVCPFLLLTVKKENDPSFHVKTWVYRIIISTGNYILHFDEYIRDTYVIKFYPIRLKHHPKRFQIVTNDHAVQAVVGTSLLIFVNHFKQNAKASFGFIATPSIIGNFREARENNQRFRIYKQVMQNFFGQDSFTHFVDYHNSAYLMANARNLFSTYIIDMQNGFSEMYPDMFDLQFAEV